MNGQFIRHLLVSLSIISALSGVIAVAQPAVASAACGRLLTFPTWYKGLVVNNQSCELKEISNDVSGNRKNKVDIRSFIIIIILNVTEMLLQLVAYATVVFLIVGGFKYITSTGDANNMANAKKTILNAIIGLIIALMAVGIVNTVSGAI